MSKPAKARATKATKAWQLRLAPCIVAEDTWFYEEPRGLNIIANGRGVRLPWAKVARAVDSWRRWKRSPAASARRKR